MLVADLFYLKMKKTLTFLQQLNKNNNREWFQAHRTEYEQSHEEMISFADQLLLEMNKHDLIETSSGKKSLYRIYRDVRFGKDKTPYKTNWAGGFKRATAELRGGYYYQIGIHGSFVMGGFFGPNAQDLLQVRHHIASNADTLREVTESNDFKNFFGELRGSQLKTAPRGFEKDHPDVDLLRYKQYTLRHDFTQKEIDSPDFHKIISNAFQEMRPFFDCMSEMLTTDLNGISFVK
jgi:uncharacterized protein (TIGR02453 family)